MKISQDWRDCQVNLIDHINIIRNIITYNILYIGKHTYSFILLLYINYIKYYILLYYIILC